jgi:hypothetical protein
LGRSTLTALRVPLFDEKEVTLFDPPETAEAQAALDRFLALTQKDRQTMTRHVEAYCRDFIEWTGDGTVDIPTADAIWTQVHPKGLFIDDESLSPANEAYVIVEADCDWEPEHGLMLCFEGGRTLTKCGGYDGHLTNSNAFDDERMANVVYSALDPKFTTRRDP